jgi:RNA polymerase sigma-70 factor (ECF subfamily)
MAIALPFFRLLLSLGRPDTRAQRDSMSPAGSDESHEERSSRNSELIRRMSGGDRNALAELYDRLSRPLFATARHILGDAAEAQDVVHDVFLALWENASRFDSRRGAAFSWAVTLTRNRSIDRLRLRANRARLLAESSPGDLGFASELEALGSDEQADFGDRAEAVRKAMAALPAEQKRALELAFFSGLTQREIAEALSEPIGTVKARIRRGLLRLRETLSRRL